MQSSIEQKYFANNPLVNQEDLKDHIGVGAVFHGEKDNILIMQHAKYNFLTIPIGKVSIHDNIDIGLFNEMQQELDVRIEKIDVLGTFHKKYHRGKKIYTHINTYLYDIISYHGIIFNKEPHKHPRLLYMSIDELMKEDPTNLSDVTRFYLYLIKGILNIPSVQLIKEK